MNIAIGIGTLLLGGWVLNTPVEDLPPDQADQIPDIEIPFSHPATHAAPSDARSVRRNPIPERGVPRDVVQGQLRTLKEPAARTGLLSENARRDALAKGQATPQLNPQAGAQSRPHGYCRPRRPMRFTRTFPGRCSFPCHRRLARVRSVCPVPVRSIRTPLRTRRSLSIFRRAGKHGRREPPIPLRCIMTPTTFVTESPRPRIRRIRPSRRHPRHLQRPSHFLAGSVPT